MKQFFSNNRSHPKQGGEVTGDEKQMKMNNTKSDTKNNNDSTINQKQQQQQQYENSPSHWAGKTLKNKLDALDNKDNIARKSDSKQQNPKQKQQQISGKTTTTTTTTTVGRPRQRRQDPKDDDDAIECGRRGGYNNSKYQNNDNYDHDNDDRSSIDETTKPGAVAVGGSRNINNNDDDEFTISDCYESAGVGQPPATETIYAENVDDEVLASKYRDKARQSIHAKIKEETTSRAVELPTSSNNDAGLRRNNKEFCIIRCILIFISIIIITGVLVVVFVDSNKTEPMISDQTEETETPTFTPFFDGWQFMKELLIQHSVLVNQTSLADTSSDQYKALHWLVYEDVSNMLNNDIEENITETIMSNLIDRYVLAVLYFATNGHDWSINSGFLGNTSVCNWEPFIACGVLGNVKAIQVFDNNLNGTIPTELAAITLLETIQFSGNSNLYGTIPSIIGQLPYLEFFSISNAAITGTIPNSLSNLTNLEYLSFTMNQLTGTIPQSITNLPLLEKLYLDFNLFHGTIPNFNKQLSIEWISMWDNLLSGTFPYSITELLNLEVLYLDDNDLIGTIPSTIGIVTNLQLLWIRNNNLSGIIPTEIGNLDYLTLLGLSENNLYGTIPTEFGKLYDLKSAWLWSNKLIGTLPSEIGQLSSLNHLSVAINLLTGTVPSTFSRMTSLEYLGIHNTSISDNVEMTLCNNNNENVGDEQEQQQQQQEFTIIKYLEADCGGDNPEVNCSCCTTCCNDDNKLCQPNRAQVCNNYERFLEHHLIDYDAICKCGTNSRNVNCLYNYKDIIGNNCQTCNDDFTICGEVTSFGYKFDSNIVPTIWYSTFQYNQSTTINNEEGDSRTGAGMTLSWEYYPNNGNCKVHVNGQECISCNRFMCDDEFPGKRIDCSNVLQQQQQQQEYDGPMIYDSCFPETGGVLDVFYWMDSVSYTGCPFLTTEDIL